MAARGQQMVVSSGYLTGNKLRMQLQRIDELGWGARLSVRFPQPFVRAHDGRNGSEVWPLAAWLLPAKFVQQQLGHQRVRIVTSLVYLWKVCIARRRIQNTAPVQISIVDNTIIKY